MLQVGTSYPGAKFKRVVRSTLADCVMSVYTGESTATMYQRSVVLQSLSNFYLSGMCGDGGYCTDSKGNMLTSFRTGRDCLCPPNDKGIDGLCSTTIKNVWTAVSG